MHAVCHERNPPFAASPPGKQKHISNSGETNMTNTPFRNRKKPILPEVDSLSILFNHRSFQKPIAVPGFWMVPKTEKIRIPGFRMEMEASLRMLEGVPARIPSPRQRHTPQKPSQAREGSPRILGAPQPIPQSPRKPEMDTPINRGSY